MADLPGSPRILIVRSNPIAPDPRVEKIARALVQAGCAVDALGWDRTGRLPAEEQREGYRVFRLPIQAEYGRGMANLPNLLRWQWGLLGWLRRNHSRYAAIHACDFDTVLPAWWVSRRGRQKLVYDIFDFYADHLRATPGWIKKIIRRVDYFAIGQADALILVDDARRVQVAGSRPRRVEIVYNSPEDERPAASAEPSPAGELRLAYVGLLQVERGLFEMLNVLKRHPEWSLDMAGFGGDEAALVEAAARMPNVRWHGRVDYAAAISLSQSADALFATYDPSIPNHRYSSPNKVFEAMMLGKPVVVAANTNMDRMIEQANCGLVVPYGDEDALEQALSRLACDPDLRRRLGECARQAYESTYSWAVMAARLRKLYADLLSGPDRSEQA